MATRSSWMDLSADELVDSHGTEIPSSLLADCAIYGHTNTHNHVKVRRDTDHHAEDHLADDCCLVTDARPWRLRSADTRMLRVSRTCTNFGNRVSAAGLRVRIYLPTDLRQLDLSYSHFVQLLKTFLFGRSDQSVDVNPAINCALAILLPAYLDIRSAKNYTPVNHLT